MVQQARVMTSRIRVLLPDPDTPVTQVSVSSGMLTSMCFRLRAQAPETVSQGCSGVFAGSPEEDFSCCGSADCSFEGAPWLAGANSENPPCPPLEKGGV